MSHLYRFLDTVGDGSGTKNAVGDYSITPETFQITAGAGEILKIHRLIVSIVDTGAMDSGGYGSASALTNGISLLASNSTDWLDFTDGVPIKKNSDWGRLAGVDVEPMDWGLGDGHLVVRFTIAKAGEPLRLNAGDSLGVLLNDNFSVLVEHYFMAQGQW